MNKMVRATSQTPAASRQAARPLYILPPAGMVMTLGRRQKAPAEEDETG